MRNIILAILVCMPLSGFAQGAKKVLDQAASAFRKAGGLEVEFLMVVKAKGQRATPFSGSICLKGEKFVLRTPGIITWFDGATQWSYLTESDEVNISDPTEEELRSINPYAILSMYQQGFDYSMGRTKTYKEKPVYEVVLTATEKRREISRLTLYIARDSYRPLSIVAELPDESRNEITITSYREGLKYEDSFFVFDKKQYPSAEIIDLR